MRHCWSNQSCGFGSVPIRIVLGSCIRIRIRFKVKIHELQRLNWIRRGGVDAHNRGVDAQNGDLGYL
jgi:hypothetical protein